MRWDFWRRKPQPLHFEAIALEAAYQMTLPKYPFMPLRLFGPSAQDFAMGEILKPYRIEWWNKW